MLTPPCPRCTYHLGWVPSARTGLGEEWPHCVLQDTPLPYTGSDLPVNTVTVGSHTFTGFLAAEPFLSFRERHRVQERTRGPGTCRGKRLGGKTSQNTVCEAVITSKERRDLSLQSVVTVQNSRMLLCGSCSGFLV